MVLSTFRDLVVFAGFLMVVVVGFAVAILLAQVRCGKGAERVEGAAQQVKVNAVSEIEQQWMGLRGFQ